MLINIKSNAKINLGLKILNKRNDGYHNIATIMQEIDFHDTIELSINKSKKINLLTSGIETPSDENNLCYKAAELFFKEYNIQNGVNIKLNKSIPIGAGLGGGSSNAANTIKGLYNLFNISIDNNIIHILCSKLGADVPFFIKGGLQLAEGIGHDLKPITSLLDHIYFLIIYPDIEISTSWAYSEYKNYLENTLIKTNFMALSDKINWSLLENDFEKVVLSTYPKISQIKDRLIESGSLFASLSGSGSTMFGVYDNLELVDNARTIFKEHQTYNALPVH
jgi:4-diphosphocytidyl-2-C-methyl-D-erythritol kinase